MITDLINKVFMILMGVFMIVILYSIVNSIGNSSSCYPNDLYGEEGLAGLGGGIFDGVYDSLCGSVIDINSGLWEVFLSGSAQWLNMRSAISSMSNGLWDMGKLFCKTHTNFDYTNVDGNDAITDPEVLLELLLYESERCWNIFEGDKDLNGDYLSKRNPIPNIGFFPCAELIYAFTDGDTLSMKRITERLYEKNSCGSETNIPTSLFWCAPDHLMEDFWYNKDNNYTKYDYNSNSIINLPNVLRIEDLLFKPIQSSYCLKNDVANTMFGKIPGYDSEDGISVISGYGKIIISYFDFFDWKKYGSESAMRAYDIYDACGGIHAFNNFYEYENLGNLFDKGNYAVSSYTYHDPDFNTNNYVISYNQNTLVLCYEKYDVPTYQCEGTLDCNNLSALIDWEKTAKCIYAKGCEHEYLGTKRHNMGDCYNVKSGCSSFLTKNICESNVNAGCSWSQAGLCRVKSGKTFDCNKCGVDIGKNSECDKATLCYEPWKIGSPSCASKSSDVCSSIDSQYECEALNSCANCEWVN